MKKVIVINSEGFGQGNVDLGKKLMGAFLKKLWASDTKPSQIILYNSGVKLLGSESTVLDALNALYDLGVDILACGTCVDFYQLGEVEVGRISNMEEIVGILMGQNDIITI